MTDVSPSDEARILASDLASEARFYSRAGKYTSDLLKSFKSEKKRGETSFIKTLDSIFTLRPGFLYCFTGWPGSGKSEFLNQLAVLQAFYKGRKIAFYSPESYPIIEFIDMILHCYMGKSTDRAFPNVCSEQEYLEAITWADQFFYICDWEDSPNADSLLQAFDYLHKNHGVEIFVVDPFNSITTEGEERNIAIALKKNLTKFKRFAHQKRVMVWLVEHPNTQKDKNEYDNVPGAHNLFGGTMWWNKVDVGVTIHRVDRHDKHNTQVIVKTWKIKKQELNGHPGEATLHFNLRTKRYYDDRYCLTHPMQPKKIVPPSYKDYQAEGRKIEEDEKLPF